MATVHVWRLDDDVDRRLEQRAVGNNRSLEGEARHIPEGAVEGEASAKRASFLALAARLRRETEGHAQTPSEVPIREDRETGHRAIRCVWSSMPAWRSNGWSRRRTRPRRIDCWRAETTEHGATVVTLHGYAKERC